MKKLVFLSTLILIASVFLSGCASISSFTYKTVVTAGGCEYTFVSMEKPTQTTDNTFGFVFNQPRYNIIVKSSEKMAINLRTVAFASVDKENVSYAVLANDLSDKDFQRLAQDYQLTNVVFIFFNDGTYKSFSVSSYPEPTYNGTRIAFYGKERPWNGNSEQNAYFIFDLTTSESLSPVGYLYIKN